MNKKELDELKNTKIEGKYEVEGDYAYSILIDGPEVGVGYLEAAYKLYDTHFKDILLKHFGALTNPSIHYFKGKLTVRLDNIKLKNGISYAEIEDHCREDWDNFYKHLENNILYKTNGGMNMDAAYENDPELHNKLDMVLTKIENI